MCVCVSGTTVCRIAAGRLRTATGPSTWDWCGTRVAAGVTGDRTCPSSQTEALVSVSEIILVAVMCSLTYYVSLIMPSSHLRVERDV